MPSDCLFCRIVKGDSPAKKLYEDDLVVAFADIHPQAPLHALVVPKEHLSTLNDVSERHEALMGRVVRAAARLAQDAGYGEKGYRLAANCQAGAGQSVFHVHFHVLAGRSFAWPPG